MGGWKEDGPQGQTRKEVTDSIVNEMATLLREKADPMPGAQAAVALVMQHKATGMKLGLASSSPMVLILAGLR